GADDHRYDGDHPARDHGVWPAVADGPAADGSDARLRHRTLWAVDRAHGAVVVRPADHGITLRLLVPGGLDQEATLLGGASRFGRKARGARAGHAMAGSLLLSERSRRSARRSRRSDGEILKPASGFGLHASARGSFALKPEAR